MDDKEAEKLIAELRSEVENLKKKMVLVRLTKFLRENIGKPIKKEWKTLQINQMKGKIKNIKKNYKTIPDIEEEIAKLRREIVELTGDE